MSFKVKNVSPIRIIKVLGVSILRNETVVLSDYISSPNIIASMTNGELYDHLMGRQLVIINADISFDFLGCTDEELSFFSLCGFVQGKKHLDQHNYPLKFDNDGYLMTSADLDVHVDGTSLVDPDNILCLGNETGVIGGTPHVIKVDGDGVVAVAEQDPIPFAFDSDGYLFTSTNINGNDPINPDNILCLGTETGAIGGTTHTLKINSDGYLLTYDNAPTEFSFDADGYAYTTSRVMGMAADDAAAAGNPVLIGGKYVTDPSADTLDTGDVGALLFNDRRMAVTDFGTLISGEDETRGILHTANSGGYQTILAAGTNLLKTGAGTLLRIIITTPTSTASPSSIAVYDNTAASGTFILRTFNTTMSELTGNLPYIIDIQADFSTGLTVVSVGTVVFTVVWK